VGVEPYSDNAPQTQQNRRHASETVGAVCFDVDADSGALTAKSVTVWKPSEKELQENVIAMARQLGWMVYHPYDSRRSTPGYPDLTLCKGRRLIMAELKTATGKVSAHQQEWIDALGQIDGQLTVVVWRPDDWLDGRIEQELRAT
jgi:hypothetical protein